jgi:hypothetical protein
LYFLFERGNALDESTVEYACSPNVQVVAWIEANSETDGMELGKDFHVSTQGLTASFGENRNNLAKAGPQVCGSKEAFRGLTAKGWKDDSARCPDITVPLVRSRIG